MSYTVRNARRAAADTFETRNTVERGPCLRQDLPRRNSFSTLRVLQAYCEVNRGGELDFASTYGEPGYTDPPKGRAILFANWNHIPKSLCDRLEAQGYELEWSDEWTTDGDTGKAYRTSPDSYGWEPQTRCDDNGELLTPDTDIEYWIDYAINEPTRFLPGSLGHKGLEAAGFAEHTCALEIGWHPGQDDTPDKFVPELQAKGFDVVLQLADVGQFDARYCIWIRKRDQE